MQYRAEIDGLRALAVLPVILFHAGFEWFSGGFAGVDVFFVISGYLITTIIISEMADDNFSIANFYERRARRILPALFFVMAACLPFAYFFMLPDPLENFGQSLVSTTFFANNILLYITTGYWDLSAEFKPLLHTWSLAVEEQFYIFFPLLLMLAWRLGKKMILGLLLVIVIGSLFLAQFEADRNLVFYSLHTRAFELILGALMCSFFIGENSLSKSIKNLLSLLGLGMLLASIILFDANTPFPSFYTLIPVLGTCLLLKNADRTTFVGRILSTRGLVRVGLLSYSAYLFHQPLFSFLRIYYKNEPGAQGYFIAILLTFLLAAFSYRCVESPFRNRSVVNTSQLWTFVLAGLMFFGVVGFYLNQSAGMPARYANDMSPLEKSRTISARVWQYQADMFEGNKPLRVLVIGNSFGRDIANVILETYDEDQFSLVYRSDITTCSMLADNHRKLFEQSSLVLFASGYDDQACNEETAFDSPYKDKTYFIGNKNFGHNLNWIMRIPKGERQYLRNSFDTDLIVEENLIRKTLPEESYISLFDYLVSEDGMLITDNSGMLISDDRSHLTLSGARLVGNRIFKHSQLNEYFLHTSN